MANFTIRVNKITGTFIIAIILTKSFAQPSLRSLESYMTEVRSNSTLPVPQAVLTDTENASQLITTLAPYYTDTLNVIRSKAYNITKRIAQKSNNAITRFNIAEEILNGTTRVERTITNNGNTITLVWTKNGNTISFGKRSDLRTILGTVGDDEAHHIVVWTKGGEHRVVQKASEDGFHLNMVENGTDLSKYKKNTK